MRFLVPFDAENPNTRLSSVFDSEERLAFARAMLDDVLTAIRNAGHEPTVLAPTPMDVNAVLEVDERELSEAVNDALTRYEQRVGIVMADLALLRAETVDRLVEAPGEIVLAPGRGGGTNAIVVDHSEFRVDYHGISYVDHLRIARDIGATVMEIDSYRLATDIDEPEDLPEVYLHGGRNAREWLAESGFELRIEEGRTVLRR